MSRSGDSPRITPSEPALRIILRRLREIMAEPSDGQSRLDRIVRQIAGLMVAEVCSIYLKRQDGSLELFATEGLNPGAVHNTFMKRGEGLVGRLLMIDARAMRFETLRYRWDKDNPLSGTAPTIRDLSIHK